ncbi:MAG TPA: hypothetical protein VJ696_11965 [Rhodanobacteraceae bacterium]|nr:hypothetical protein [Rhodanobacteraceae bacterium]
MRASVLRRSMPASLCVLALVSASALAADAREDVFKAFQKMMGSRFSVDITTAAGDDTMRSHGEYDTVQRIHFKNDRMEMIVVPEGTWMRTGSEWTRPPVDMSGMVRQFVPKTIDDLRAGTKSATDEGMSSWNGIPVHVYGFVVDTTVMGIHVTSSNRIYVDASGRIVHSEGDGEAMGRKSHTTQDIRYDDSIRVTAPH